MQQAQGPLHKKTFRDNYLAVICTAVLLLISFCSNAQVFPPNSKNYGVQYYRGSFDSALYFPTACGVPTDSTWLFSQGFGQGQKMKKFGIYGDSCGHKAYLWDPSLQSWSIMGSGSSSADSAIFATVYRLDTAKQNIRNTIAQKDSSTIKGLWITIARVGKNIIISADSASMSAYFLRRADSGSAYITPFSSPDSFRIYSISDSIYFCVTHNGIEACSGDTLPQGISSVLTQRSVTGNGTSGSPIQLVNDTSALPPDGYSYGFKTGRRGYYPVAAATIPPNIGSAFRVYSPQVPGFKTISALPPLLIDSATANTLTFKADTSAGRTHFPTQSQVADTSALIRSIIAAIGFPQVLAVQRLFSANDSMNMAFKTFKLQGHGQYIFGDTVRGPDSTVALGDSWTVGAVASPLSLGYMSLTAGYMSSQLNNLSASGATMATMTATQLPAVPNYSAKYRFIFIMIGVNDAAATLNTTWAASYKAVIDTLHLNRGYPNNRIVLLTSGYTTVSAEAIRQRFRDTTIAVAAAKGVIAIDMYGVMVAGGGRLLISADSLHPTNQGHYILARGIVDQLNSQSINVSVGGNIGIGTLTPIFPLDVMGRARITGDILADSLTVGRGSGNDYTNTVFGVTALAARKSATAGNEVAIGLHALSKDTSGTFNVAIGPEALLNNLSGASNVAVGHATMSVNTTGGGNTAVGEAALNANIGSNNTAFGYQAGLNNTSGTLNVALGMSSLLNNQTGIHMTAVGQAAGKSIVGGSDMTTVGYQSLNNNTGSGNMAFGTYAGFGNTSAINSLFLGYQSGFTANVSNRLYIANNDTTHLIWGDFLTHRIQINGLGTVSSGLSHPSSAKLEINGMDTWFGDSTMYAKVRDASNSDSVAMLFRVSNGTYSMRKAAIGSGLTLSGGVLSATGSGSNISNADLTMGASGHTLTVTAANPLKIAGQPTLVPVITTQALVKGTDSSIQQMNLTAGYYSPIVSNYTNCSAISNTVFQYQQIGKIVHVTGYVTIQLTASTGNFSFFVSLPTTTTASPGVGVGSQENATSGTITSVKTGGTTSGGAGVESILGNITGTSGQNLSVAFEFSYITD